MSERQAGRVVWFNNLTGVGALTHAGFDDVYCHYSSINRPFFKTLVQGETVEYDIVIGPNGEEARNVTVFPE